MGHPSLEAKQGHPIERPDVAERTAACNRVGRLMELGAAERWRAVEMFGLTRHR